MRVRRIVRRTRVVEIGLLGNGERFRPLLLEFSAKESRMSEHLFLCYFGERVEV
jgi:hypothetical protein